MQREGTILRAARRGLLLAVSMAALSGCVSAVSNDMRADNRIAPATEVAAASDADESVGVAEGSAESDTQTDPNSANMASSGTPTDSGSDMAGVVMQPTTLDAGRSSIFSTAGAATGAMSADGGAVPAYSAQSGGANPALSSIYSNGGSAQSADGTGRLPLEDMPVPDLSGQQALPATGDEGALALPGNVPLPKSSRSALVAESNAGNAADQALAPDTDTSTAALPAGEDTTRQNPSNGRKTLTLASLFGGKRKDGASQFDGERFAEKPRRVLNRDTVNTTRKASLGVNSLPGVTTGNTILPASQVEEDGDYVEETPRFKEVASLAGLARLAPNGLWLQTEKVRTGCFEPKLLGVLKTIEKHYGKPIIVTSGLREAKRNRSRQSLHTRCAAADIQIAGVNKWELADYVRTMPGRGGVGTYCHTESVHVDIGPERDWNWRCRRKK